MTFVFFYRLVYIPGGSTVECGRGCVAGMAGAVLSLTGGEGDGLPPRAWCTGTGAPWTGAPPQGEPPPTAEGCVPQSSDHYVHQTPSPAKSADPNCRHKRSGQCSPASPPKGPGSQVATLSCDSAALAPCGTKGATLPPPVTST